MEIIEELYDRPRQRHCMVIILHVDVQLVRMERDLQLGADVKTAF